MVAETKKVTLTNNASKFEILLYQFIKLYNRLNLEHGLTTERELKLIKNLEDFKEIILALNNTTSSINSTTNELTQIELKLSAAIQSNVAEVIGRLRSNLIELSHRVLDQGLGQYMQCFSSNLHYAINKLEELMQEKAKRDVRVFLMLLGVGALIGLLIGVLIRVYIFK